MQRGIAILLTLTFSTLFAVDTPKESVPPTESITSQEIQFDAEEFQKNKSLKKGMAETFKQARRANGIPKPDMKPTRVSNNKPIPTSEEVSFKENSNKIAAKKSFKELLNVEIKKDKQAKKEAFLEKQNIAKLKRDEFRASREKILNMRQSHSTHQIQSSRVKANNRSNNRNSRDGGTEFEFESVGELYDAFGDVLESNGAGCDGCDGNLEMMEVEDYLDIGNEDEFNEWGMSFGFDSYYFQFIDGNQSGEYDEGEIYAVSCENGYAPNVHSTADFVDPSGVNIQLSFSSTGWEGTGGGDNGGIYVGPHISVQPDGFNTPDGDGYFVRNYTGTSTSKYAITKEADDNTIQGADRGNIVFTADWAANTDLGARFVAIVDGVWYASDQFGMATDDHGNMNQTQVSDWEVDLSVNADTDNWYISLAGPPSGYDWRDGNQWDPNPAVAGGGLPAGDITQFGMAWLHTSNYDYGAVDNFSVTNTSNETNRTVAYNGNVFHLNYEEFWMEAYDFDWYNGNSEDFGNIFGTVRDEFENSIPHANLHIWNSNPEGQNFQFEADENGYFSVDVELGEYHVEAYFEGYMSQWMVVVVNEGDSIEVFFNLEEENTNDGPFVEGIVRDFNENPLANAYVHANSGVGFYYDVQTDENGYYHIELDTAVIHFMDVYVDGYWEDITHVDVDDDGTQKDFALGVVDETAIIEIWAGTPEWESVPFANIESDQSPQDQSMTDIEGWDFITVDPSEGFADIYGYSEEYGEAYLHLEEIEAGTYYERAIYFYGDSTGGGETGTFSGMIWDEEERPLNGLVEFSSPEHDDDFTANADGGEFSIELPAGVWSANAHDGDGGNGEYWSDRYDGILYIEPETEQSHDFYLFPRAYYGFLDIRAWVHDENGESHPIPGAYIYIEDSSATMSYELELDIWSQADQAIEPNPYLVHISTEYGEQDDWVYAPAGEQTIVEFYFEMENNEHGLIEGHVYNNDGYPIQDAVIEGWNEETAFSTYTDHNGYFGMEVMSGSYELEAHAVGYSTEWDYVEVYPNESSYVEFWLDWENDMTMVSGQVADDEGNPISFALVNASYLYDEWESEGSLTDENGYFELYLEEGDYRISAGAEGYWVDAYDSVYVGNDSLWLDFNLTAIEQFDGGWSGNVNLVGNHEPEMIFLGIMSEDYQVLRLLNEPGFQEVPLVNGTYHLFAGADGYQDVFMPNAIQIENNMVSFDIHLFEEGFVNPPHIEFAGDVPNDQGRQMRLVWNPGTPGEWNYFPFYSIWRQVNEVPMPLWDFVEVVPWHGMEAYSAVVPTLGDSTDMGIYYSTFRVTAHTDDPMVFYDSEPVTGYSIDNLHPGAPGGVQAFNQDDGILLVWDQPLDEDFGYHKVYRLDLDSEDPAIEFTTSDTFFVDNVANSYLEYWVTAVDLNGNESDPSNVVTITLAIEDGLTIPIEFALQQNYPNPFNPSTQIQYALPTDATVSITIYDLMGREVRSLVNKQVNAGYHSTLWNATNAMGAPVSAGVYIYTITANEYRDVKKMILLK